MFLNHGSFGAPPDAVGEYRISLLREMAAQPLDFMLRRYMPALPGILESLEDFTGAQRGSVVLVPNATTGVNTVLSNLDLDPGDQLVTTGQEYFASRNALMFFARRSGATVVEVPLELPVSDPG